MYKIENRRPSFRNEDQGTTFLRSACVLDGFDRYSLDISY